jgi:hypothetical protein
MRVFAYRLTKYDPRKRNTDGYFIGEEWTSVSDIGRTLGGQTLSLSEYLECENAYVESVRVLLAAADISSMRVTDLSQGLPEHQFRLDDAVSESCRQVKDQQAVSGSSLEGIVRGCLREYMWCRLSGDGGSYLHFGYDYYMYVACRMQRTRSSCQPACSWRSSNRRICRSTISQVINGHRLDMTAPPTSPPLSTRSGTPSLSANLRSRAPTTASYDWQATRRETTKTSGITGRVSWNRALGPAGVLPPGG